MVGEEIGRSIWEGGEVWWEELEEEEGEEKGKEVWWDGNFNNGPTLMEYTLHFCKMYSHFKEMGMQNFI